MADATRQRHIMSARRELLEQTVRRLLDGPSVPYGSDQYHRVLALMRYDAAGVAGKSPLRDAARTLAAAEPETAAEIAAIDRLCELCPEDDDGLD